MSRVKADKTDRTVNKGRGLFTEKLSQLLVTTNYIGIYIGDDCFGWELSNRRWLYLFIENRSLNLSEFFFGDLLNWSSKSRSAQKPYWSRLDRIDLTVWWLHSG